MTAVAIIFAALLIIAANFLFLGVTSNRLAKIEAKVDQLRRALAEIGGRTAPVTENASARPEDFPPSPRVH
jgi:hypothetical protein